MSKIRILPDILSNKIAAGEVVERPSSVVKELVENALDAGATRLLIDIEQGGRRMIRVADNGCGMGRDDALLAIERYATSKIYTDEDLFRIRTLGFRGEALPSIASVSRFVLLTRDEGSEAAVELTVEGGRLVNVGERGAPRGTLASVGELFFNTPARRKFLKSIATEMAHITDAVAGTALGRPEVHFRLAHNGKPVKNWPAVADPFERAIDVLGAGMRGELHAVKGPAGEVGVSGWVSSPRAFRRTAGGVFVFVNGRLVRDRVIQHALFKAYAQRLVKGQFPSAVLFVTVPFDQVDVNVHPTKTEVRFARPDAVHEAVRRAAAQTLYDIDRPQWGPAVPAMPSDAGAEVAETGSEFGVTGAPARFPIPESGIRKAGFPRREEPAHPSAGPEPAPPQPGRQAGIWGKSEFSGLKVIGQLHDTYILCEGGDGLILIDQHAAHERVLYEALARRDADHPGRPAQTLLVPETVELGFREARAIASVRPYLEELGIAIEPFGGNTFIVKSVPAALAGHPAGPLLVEIAETAAEGPPAPEAARERCLKLAACHGSIRARQRLTLEEMQHLLRQMDACADPAHCPHGRPTWLRYGTAEIERGFRRVG
jgi:DNA mismatch repair protein MutL